MTEKISLNRGLFSVSGLWTLSDSYKIPNFEPNGLSFLYVVQLKHSVK